MRLEIHSRSFPLTPYLSRHVEGRVHHALDRVLPRVSVVSVRLADVNGPRGGSDKHCGVTVRLADGQTVVIRELDACAYRVVDRAVTRMKRQVKERLKAQRQRRRGRLTIRRPDREPGDDDADAAAVA